jgi:hypothetical protein
MVAPEVQAYEVTSLVNRLGGAELGVRQDSFLYHLVLLGILGGHSLPRLAAFLADPILLADAAARSTHPDVRAFFAGAPRVAAASMEGVRARLHRLLRHPGTRLMLGARDCISFRSLLAGKIVLADIGSPPLGCEDLGRFWAGLLTLKLARAIFERRHNESEPVLVVVDEWQEGLAGGGDIAEHYERVLAQARSRRVSFLLVSQSLAGAARVSSSLPRVVATNTQLQLLFRASAEDARAMEHLLPITGRRPRRQGLPWEEPARTPFLSVSEERDELISGITSLPDRSFYLWNRRRPYRAQRVLARTVDAAAPRLVGSTVSRLLREGTLAVPVPELEAQASANATTTRFRGASGRRVEAGSEPTNREESEPPSPPPRRRRPRRRRGE